ncbi:MAG: methyl-accepting chemotaxis protein [Treponema sp.]|nr:methyl-accepting chemotaxis protein [Treponema sp.]
MKIKTKLLSGFAVVAAIGILLGLLGLYGESWMVRSTKGVVDLADSGATTARILSTHHEWREGLSQTVYRGTPFAGALDSRACALGRWLASDEIKAVTDPRLLELLSSIIAAHDHMHAGAGVIVDHVAAGNFIAATEHFERYTLNDAAFVIAGLEGMNGRSVEMLQEEAQAVFQFGNNLMWVILIGIIVAAAACILLTTLIIRNIVKPISAVTSALKDISEGEGDLTKVLTVNTKDEMGELSRYFNMTLKKIKGLVVTIKGEAARLSEIGVDLANNMNETAASMNEITATIGSIKSLIVTQSASVSEANATMGEVASNINRLSGHIENQGSHISQTSSAIEQMVANINSVTETLVRNSSNVMTLKDASEVGRFGLHEVNADIREIARESEGLLEINQVMQNIASQTNLLSMNAAIEAAHAGDSGRGFAVVADEIRKLAENSSAQSKTIGIVLKKMKDSIDKITHSTENVLDKFEAIDASVGLVAEQGTSIRDAMEEQQVGGRQVLSGIMQVNDMTGRVKTGSGEMLVGAKEVILEGSRLEKSTQEITSGISEIVAGAQQINVAVDHVNRISIQNRESIEHLVQEVSRFKVE